MSSTAKAPGSRARRPIIAQSEDGRPRFVAGAIGPTNRTASISPDVANPGFRAITFDELRTAYAEQVEGLIEGGADLLLIETIFDTLNAKAAIAAIADVVRGARRSRAGHDLGHHHRSLRPPSLRTDAGGVLEFGAACGAILDRPQLRARRGRDARAYRGDRRASPTRSCAPIRMPGCQTSSAATMKARPSWPRCWASSPQAGLVNIVGGCCGTTPEHIRAIAARGRRQDAARSSGAAARCCDSPASRRSRSRRKSPSSMSGERTNVTGSAKFRKLITAGDYAAALAIARDQVENGAQIIDVNMDEGLLDSEKAMTTFLNLIAAEPDIARVPVMVDSSKFSVIEAGLKCLQGKPVVNSISLKEGEAAFIEHARIVRRYGAAVVVMAFDEQGQADTLERKMRDLRGAPMTFWSNVVGFPPEDIIFDPNIFAVATGMEEHNGYGVAFIEAARGDPAELAARACLGRRIQPVVLVSRQRAGARGDALGVSLPRDQGRHGHGHRQCRADRGV